MFLTIMDDGADVLTCHTGIQNNLSNASSTVDVYAVCAIPRGSLGAAELCSSFYERLPVMFCWGYLIATRGNYSFVSIFVVKSLYNMD